MSIKLTYSQPASELPGYKTLVTPDPVPGQGEPDSALPTPPWTRSKPTGPTYYNKHDVTPHRTLNEPGEDRPVPNPEPSTLVVRRPEMRAAGDREGAMNGPAYPPSQLRQKDQRGQARMYHKKWYRSHRGKIKNRALRWWKKNHNKFNYKKDQQRRRKWPAKFERKPGGGVKENKNRTQEWRDKNSALEEWIGDPEIQLVGNGNPVFFVQSSTDRDGWVVGVNPDTGEVVVLFDQTDTLENIPIETFFEDADFLSEEDANVVMADLDAVFGWSEDMTERVACRWAEMLYEKRPPEMDPETVWNRGSDRSKWWTQGPPAEDMDGGWVPDNPGSAKVIPDNRDFVNNKAAALIADIRKGCDPSILEKAKGVQFRKIRSDKQNLVWLFNVEGSEGKSYRVRAKVIPKGNVRDVAKADIMVSCSCPFWRWQGPEHWALEKGYLYGKPKGSAENPDVRDPDGKHLMCKHVAAILDRISGWSVRNKVAVVSVSWQDFMTDEVVRRYCEAWR